MTFDQLYGAQRDGAASSLVAPSSPTTAQTARLEVERGTTPDAPLAVPFVARAVTVDNPSGSWYVVNGRRVPPWTIGGVVRFETPTGEIAVRAEVPAGQLAEAVGAPLVLVATDAELEPRPGVYTPPAVAVDYQYAQLLYRANSAAASQALVAAIADERIVLVHASVMLVAHPDAKATGLELVGVSLLNSTLPRYVLFEASVSPAAPTFAASLPPAAQRTVAGAGVDVVGSGSAMPAYLSITVTYYRAAA